MAKQLNEWLDEFVENGANPSDVTDWPENAGGGGSAKIVDSLPAEGVEGSTYLLRHTTETLPMRFKCYTWLWSNNYDGDVGYGIIVTDDYTEDEIKNAFLEKIGCSIPVDLNYQLYPVWTEAQFAAEFASNTIYVSTEEEFINTDFSSHPNNVLQYHGVIGLEDFVFVQSIDDSYGYIDFRGYKSSLTTKIQIVNNQIIVSHRQPSVDVNEHGYFPPYEEPDVYTIVETLTDSYEEDPEFWQEHEEDAVRIIVTGQIKYEYSYTEYVFDHGIYTEVGAKSSEKLYDVFIYNQMGGYNWSITLKVDTLNLSTYQDLYDYLINKGFNGGYQGGTDTYAWYNCTGVFDMWSIHGISVDLSDNEIVYLRDGGDAIDLQDSEYFSITYLGNEN